jgi:hypothetical protein
MNMFLLRQNWIWMVRVRKKLSSQKRLYKNFFADCDTIEEKAQTCRFSDDIDQQQHPKNSPFGSFMDRLSGRRRELNYNSTEN